MSTVRTNIPTKSSKTSFRRKYLGDPEDPHFVPDSPIISRQTLTSEQEDELTRSCTLVLSGVPHSDDVDDDPSVKHVTTRVNIRGPRAYQEREKSTFTKYTVGTSAELSHKSQKLRYIGDDTVTPSVVSKRDTLDRTNTSTPLTALSENLRRSSSTQQNAAWRIESKPTKPQAVYEAFENPHTRDAQERKSALSKSMTLLPISGMRMPQSPAPVSGGRGKRGNISISHLEYNKSLPSLPKVEESEAIEKNSAGVLRFLKSIQKKTVDLSASTKHYSDQSNIQRAQTAPAVLPAKKNKFSFTSLFERKRRQLPTQVVVL